MSAPTSRPLDDDEPTPLDLETCAVIKQTIEIVLAAFNAESAVVMATLNHLVAELCLEYAEGDHEMAKGHANHFHAEILRIMREELH